MRVINDLWNWTDEQEWKDALDGYWDYVKPENVKLEKALQSLTTELVRGWDAEQWYKFLKNIYFPWKYTAANRRAQTTRRLGRYEEEGRLPFLHSIKDKLLRLNPAHIGEGLEIALSIDGLGPAGASGLLAQLYPRWFGCADQFVVKALAEVQCLPERSRVLVMLEHPDSLTEKDAMLLIAVMRKKALELNKKFSSDAWTPRRMDMILWASRSGEACCA